MKAPFEPEPRTVQLALKPLEWPVARRIGLPNLVPPQPGPFAEIVATRRSSRSIRRAPLREIVNFISFSTNARFQRRTPSSRASRPAHSAGGLHPVDVILVSGIGRRRVYRFDAEHGMLERLHVSEEVRLQELNVRMAKLFPDADCDYLVLLADRALVEANYTWPDTLVWRDAGALMQTLHFCASAYRLAFCPGGILGWELARALFGEDSRVLAVGVAVVGRFPAD